MTPAPSPEQMEDAQNLANRVARHFVTSVLISDIAAWIVARDLAHDQEKARLRAYLKARDGEIVQKKIDCCDNTDAKLLKRAERAEAALASMTKEQEDYRDGQAIVCDEAVKYLAQFHGNRCKPLAGECSCWTETQQKHFQARARALRELAALKAQTNGRKA